MKLKDIVKLRTIIERIQTSNFDQTHVDNLLMYLRDYATKEKTVFLEVAHFVAHSSKRDKGLAQQSITAFVDSIQYFQEYVSEKRPLNLGVPFPAYIYRLFLSQASLLDERRLKAEHRMSHSSLIDKIKANFKIDKKTNICSLQHNKGGVELFAALRFVIGFIHSRPAFHIRDFHKELKDVMRAQNVIFDEAAWDTQADRISLAILCLVSNTEFLLANEDEASCKLETEHHFRLLNGQRRLPNRIMSSEPTNFGRLMILGQATVNSVNKAPLRIAFPLIDTDLDPHEHCDPKLFVQEQATEDFGNCMVEIINLAPDMSLSADFLLVRTDSLFQ